MQFLGKTTVATVAMAIATTFSSGMTAHATTLVNIGTNFTGTSSSQSGFIPPDTMGAVGPNHIVELLNGAYAVYDKNGNFQSRVSLDDFWVNAGVTPAAGSFAFDPRILYDPFSQRWFAASVDNAGELNNFLVAVSNSSNPLDGWQGYSIDSDSNDTQWADFPTLGINGQSVTLAANMFPVTGSSFTTTILTLDKAALITGSLSSTIFQNNNPNDTGFTVQPVVDQDNRNNPHPLLSAFNTPAGFFKRSDITGTPPSTTLSTGGGFIPITAYNNPPLAQQSGGPDNVNTGDSRFSSNIVYQFDALGFNSFWGVQSVLSPFGRSALRWFEIDAATNLVRQEGLIYDTAGEEDYYYGSLAVNDWREVVIGFSCSGLSLFISSCAVVGEDTAGTTSFGSRLLLQQGTSSYEALDGNGINRWGDYSATVLDPSDPTGNTFWTFQEIATGSNQWSIQVTEINLIKVNVNQVPENSAVAGLFALGTLGAASTLKRKLKKN